MCDTPSLRNPFVNTRWLASGRTSGIMLCCNYFCCKGTVYVFSRLDSTFAHLSNSRSLRTVSYADFRSKTAVLPNKPVNSTYTLQLGLWSLEIRLGEHSLHGNALLRQITHHSSDIMIYCNPATMGHCALPTSTFLPCDIYQYLSNPNNSRSVTRSE